MSVLSTTKYYTQEGNTVHLDYNGRTATFQRDRLPSQGYIRDFMLDLYDAKVLLDELRTQDLDNETLQARFRGRFQSLSFPMTPGKADKTFYIMALMFAKEDPFEHACAAGPLSYLHHFGPSVAQLAALLGIDDLDNNSGFPRASYRAGVAKGCHLVAIGNGNDKLHQLAWAQQWKSMSMDPLVQGQFKGYLRTIGVSVPDNVVFGFNFSYPREVLKQFVDIIFRNLSDNAGHI
ncbi:hypothetical protein GGF32_006372 [Allomyces javanicus]|nr:hypothetical protein GGF32_006372 [Allomyces javanicus]